jgi:hypothetical protein
MSKSKKPFVVRGFDVTTEGYSTKVNGNAAAFDCKDAMTKFGSFTEVVVDKQHDAVVEMATHSVLSTMSARHLVDSAVPAHIIQTKSAADAVKELYVVDLVIVTNFTNVADIRPYRSQIRETLKLWAEKSRVRGRRGWRSNAIKTPTVEFDKKIGSVIVRTNHDFER